MAADRVTAVTESLVDRLRRLDKEATPGPWRVPPRFEDECPGSGVMADDGDWIATTMGHVLIDESDMRDADLIAAMRNALPALLRLVEAAKPSASKHFHAPRYDPDAEAIVEDEPCWVCELRDALAALDAPEAQT